MRKDGHLGARGATHAGPTVEGQVQLHLGSGYANGIENGTGDLKKKKKSHPPRRRKRSDKLPDPGVTGASPTIMSLLESILRDEA
jgi:hypothetical protein